MRLGSERRDRVQRDCDITRYESGEKWVQIDGSMVQLVACRAGCGLAAASMERVDY